MQQSPVMARFFKLALGLLCLMLATPLAVYAYHGLFMRYSGDDFCYAGILRVHGFIETQWFSYLHSVMYNGDRYSLTFFASLAGLFPPAADGILPGLAIILLLIGLTWVLLASSRIFEKQSSNRPEFWVFFLLAEGLVFFTFDQVPNIDQSLFWRSGMLPYLAPLIANIFLTGFIISHIQKTRSQGWGLLGCFVIAILAGGFSETGAALQGAYLGIAMLGALIALRKGIPEARRLFGMVSVAVIGTLVSILLLYFSPANQNELAAFSAPPSFMKLGSIIMNSMEIFLYISIKKQFGPNIILVLFFFLAGLFSYKIIRPDSPNILWRWLMTEIIIGISGAVLLASTMIPFAYLQQSYPYERALITTRFVFVLFEGAASWLAGCAFFGSLLRVSPNTSHPILSRRSMLALISFASVLFILTGLYPLQTARTEIAQTPRLLKWAAFWDARDKTIKEAVLEQRSSVKVVAIDHIISGVADLSPDPTQWYNGCAAIYYGVNSISASLPGWDQ